MYWIRYFKSAKTMKNMYSSFIGSPVAGATLLVGTFGLLSIYDKYLFFICYNNFIGNWACWNTHKP